MKGACGKPTDDEQRCSNRVDNQAGVSRLRIDTEYEALRFATPRASCEGCCPQTRGGKTKHRAQPLVAPSMASQSHRRSERSERTRAESKNLMANRDSTRNHSAPGTSAPSAQDDGHRRVLALPVVLRHFVERLEKLRGGRKRRLALATGHRVLLGLREVHRTQPLEHGTRIVATRRGTLERV